MMIFAMMLTIAPAIANAGKVPNAIRPPLTLGMAAGIMESIVWLDKHRTICAPDSLTIRDVQKIAEESIDSFAKFGDSDLGHISGNVLDILQRKYPCKSAGYNMSTNENPVSSTPPPEPHGAKSPIHDKTSCIAYSETIGSVVGASWAAYCQGATGQEIIKVVEAAHNKATTKLMPEDFKNAHNSPSQELCSSIQNIVNMFGLKGAAASAQIKKSMSITVENEFKELNCKNY